MHEQIIIRQSYVASPKCPFTDDVIKLQEELGDSVASSKYTQETGCVCVIILFLIRVNP